MMTKKELKRLLKLRLKGLSRDMKDASRLISHVYPGNKEDINDFVALSKAIDEYLENISK